MGADGSIKIDTEIDEKGFEKGSEELLAAIKSLTNSIDNLSKGIKDAFNSMSGEAKQAAKDVDEVTEAEERAKKAADDWERRKQKQLELMQDPNFIQRNDLPIEEVISDDAKKSVEGLKEELTSMQTVGESSTKSVKDNFEGVTREVTNLKGAVQTATNSTEAELDGSGRHVGSLKNAFTLLGDKAVSVFERIQASMAGDTSQYDLGDKLDEYKQKLKELEAQGIHIGDADYDKTFIKLKQTEQAVEEYKRSLMGVGSAAGKGSRAVGALASVTNRLNQTGKKIKEIFKNAFAKIISGAKGLTKALHSTNNTVKQTQMSLGKLILMGAGFRSLYTLWRRLMSGIKEGFSNLAQYSNQTNTSISSLMSSMTRLKNSFATAFNPILNVVAPILSKFINMIADAVTYVGMFFAALSGQKTFTKAIGVQEDYAGSLQDTSDALDDANEKANELKGTLTSFDRAEVLDFSSSTSSSSSNNGNNGGVDPSQMFQEVPIENEISKLADKIKDIFSKIFDPIKEAWDKKGKDVIDAFKRALDEIWGLVKSIGESFMDVWTNGTGELFIRNLLTLLETVLLIIGDIAKAFKDAWNDNGLGTAVVQSLFDMFNKILSLLISIGQAFRNAWNDNGLGKSIATNILEIFKGIFDTIGNIASALETAWNKNKTGEQIIRTILTIFNDALEVIKNMTTATAEWAAKIDFSPLLSSVLGLLQAIQPLTKNVFEGVEWFYKNVLLPLASYTITNLVPAFLDLLAAAITAVNSVIEALKPLAQWLWDSFLKPLAEWTGGVIIDFLNMLTDALLRFSDWCREHQGVIEAVVKVIVAFFAAWKVTQFIAGIMSIIGAIGKFVISIKSLIDLVGGLSGVLGVLVTALGGPVTAAILAIMAVLALLVAFWPQITAEFDKFTAAIQKKIDVVKIGFGAMGEYIKKALSDMGFNEWLDNIKDICGQVINFLQGVFTGNLRQVGESIKKMFDSLFKAILALIKSPVNGIIDLINGLIDRINSIQFPSWVPGVGGGTTKIPKIPKLATGTVIPPNAPFLAMLGDQKSGTNIEAPISTIEDAVNRVLDSRGGGGGQDVTINFTGELAALARILKPEIDKETTRRGVTLVESTVIG